MPRITQAMAIHERLMAEQAEAAARQMAGAVNLARSTGQFALHMSVHAQPAWPEAMGSPAGAQAVAPVPADRAAGA